MKKISKGFKKYLRQEKARIRREKINPKDQKKLIDELYSNIKEKENTQD